MKLNVYKVSYKIPNYGIGYDWEGNSYYKSKFGFSFITTSTSKIARELFKAGCPEAKILKINKLGNA